MLRNRQDCAQVFDTDCLIYGSRGMAGNYRGFGILFAVQHNYETQAGRALVPSGSPGLINAIADRGFTRKTAIVFYCYREIH